jgi:hypothetical protein
LCRLCKPFGSKTLCHNVGYKQVSCGQSIRVLYLIGGIG